MQIQIKAKESTTYSTLMDYKILKGFALIVLMLTLTGCPGENVLGYPGKSAIKENLVIVTPLQNLYNVGDEINFKIEIPSKNNYFSSDIDVFSETKKNTGVLDSFFGEFFNDEIVTVIKGNYQPTNSYKYILNYNPVNDSYELELKIKMIKTKTFDYTSGLEKVTFTKNNGGVIILNTSVSGIDPTQPYQLKVQ